MVKIRDANGQVREGTWPEFWQDYHNTLKHGYQSPSKKKVEHAKVDHSFAAAQREMAKTMGQGFADAFGGGDRRPIEKRIADEVAKQLNQAPKSQGVTQAPTITSTPKPQPGNFTLADTQKELRERGVPFEGHITQSSAQRQQSTQTPTREAITHVFKQDPMLPVLMLRRPDMFQNHEFWAPYYREAVAQSSQARRVTHSAVGPTMIVKPIIVKPIMVKP